MAIFRQSFVNAIAELSAQDANLKLIRRNLSRPWAKDDFSVHQVDESDLRMVQELDRVLKEQDRLYIDARDTVKLATEIRHVAEELRKVLRVKNKENLHTVVKLERELELLIEKQIQYINQLRTLENKNRYVELADEIISLARQRSANGDVVGDPAAYVPLIERVVENPRDVVKVMGQYKDVEQKQYAKLLKKLHKPSRGGVKHFFSSLLAHKRLPLKIIESDEGEFRSFFFEGVGNPNVHNSFSVKYLDYVSVLPLGNEVSSIMFEIKGFFAAVQDLLDSLAQTEYRVKILVPKTLQVFLASPRSLIIESDTMVHVGFLRQDLYAVMSKHEVNFVFDRQKPRFDLTSIDREREFKHVRTVAERTAAAIARSHWKNGAYRTAGGRLRLEKTLRQTIESISREDLSQFTHNLHKGVRDSVGK